MRIRDFAAALILSACALAQAAPSECPADRPVDDIIAELQKQQAKKNNRNRNPFPDSVCVFGWCKGAKTPPTLPKPAPHAETAASPDVGAETTSSSSKSPTDSCSAAMERALEAAHNVEVADYYVLRSNFRAALYRYQDAAEEKPQDTAIHVRLGRVLEKLNELPKALQEYKTAEKIPGPEKWLAEARAALTRLQREQ